MNDNQRISNTIREPSPCRDCPERFIACADNCPIDARGGYGINAWHEEIKRVKKNKKEYLRREAVRWPKYNTYEEEG